MTAFSPLTGHVQTDTGRVMSVLRSMQRSSLLVRVAVTGSSIAGSVALDSVVGPDTSLLAGYAVATFAAAWLLPQWVAVAVATTASVATAWIRLVDPAFGAPTASIYLNAGFRFLTLCLLLSVVSALRVHIAIAERAATTDPLTGVLSRSATFRALEDAIDRAARHRRAVNVVYFDLDGLKRVNDERGHAAGDDQIRRFTDSLRGRVRSTDLLGRVGGDEFVMICPDIDLQSVTALLSALERDPWMPSASYGIVSGSPGDTAEQLLSRADAAMYERKLRRRAPDQP